MGAHAHRAIHDTSFYGPLAPRVNVLDREIALGCRGFANGFGDRTLFDAATVEDAGLVEMDMRLDHAGDHETTRGIQFSGISLQSWRYGRNRRATNADIDDTKLAVLQRAGIADDEVHQFTAAGWAPK
jgi:hypothetical protein